MGDAPIRYTKAQASYELSWARFFLIKGWHFTMWGFRRWKPILYHPTALLGLGAFLTAYLLQPWVAATLTLLALLWPLVAPHSYLHHAQPRIDSFKTGWRYRHRPRRKLTACALLNDKDPIPTISHIQKTGCITKVRIRMIDGDHLDMWRVQAPRLAQTYNALDCKVNPYRREVLNPFSHQMVTKPRWLVLDFLTRDPFSTGLGIEYLDYHRNNTLTPVVATLRNGETYEDDLETHTLAVAMTRRGKSNRIRASIYAHRYNIQNGLLEEWMIDGKGGVEGAFLEHQVARHAYGDTELNANAYNPAEFDRLLKEGVKVLKRRQKAMRGKTTKHTPTKKEPWLRIRIDELLVLTSKAVPPEIRTSIAASIRLIQQQGIACGVSLDASTQLAQKELIDFRDGFTKFEVGKVERGAVDMIFGTGWWERGARADEIPDDLPGVFYVKTDATMTPTEIRYPLVTDADLRTLPPARASVLWPVRHLTAVQPPTEPSVEEAGEVVEEELVSRSSSVADEIGGFA